MYLARNLLILAHGEEKAGYLFWFLHSVLHYRNVGVRKHVNP